jgi:hypothetical protein
MIMKGKFYNLTELAALYEIDPRTLKKRIEPFFDELNTIGIDDDQEPIIISNNKVLYSPHQVKLIFEKLGDPTQDISLK